MARLRILAQDLRVGDILYGTRYSGPGYWHVLGVYPDNRMPEWPGVVVRVDETGNLVFRNHVEVEIERDIVGAQFLGPPLK